MKETFLITGANRGIGLELTKLCLSKNFNVEACCRNPETSDELNTLKSEISGFDDTLSAASTNINESTESISSSVNSIEEASSQLNSLLFPIIASIGIIVALQITIIARRR